MKNLFRYLMATIMVAFVFSVVSADAQDAIYVRALYEKMDKNLQTLTSLKTGIRRETYNPQIKDYDDRREGTVIFIPIKNSKSINFRVDWTKGAQESLSVYNGEYTLYKPSTEQVFKGKSKDVQKKEGAGDMFKLISMSAKDLKANFDAKWSGQEVVANVYSTYKLQLTPKTAMSFSSAEVWVDENGMILQVKVYEKTGEWTNILLINPQKNAKISKSDFVINYPKGTPIIKG